MSVPAGRPPKTRQGTGPAAAHILCLPGAPAPPLHAGPPALQPGLQLPGSRASSGSQARAPGLAPVGSSRPGRATWAVLQERPGSGDAPQGRAARLPALELPAPRTVLRPEPSPREARAMASSPKVLRAGWSSAARGRQGSPLRSTAPHPHPRSSPQRLAGSRPQGTAAPWWPAAKTANWE